MAWINQTSIRCYFSMRMLFNGGIHSKLPWDRWYLNILPRLHYFTSLYKCFPLNYKVLNNTFLCNIQEDYKPIKRKILSIQYTSLFAELEESSVQDITITNIITTTKTTIIVYIHNTKLLELILLKVKYFISKIWFLTHSCELTIM